ncbi:MAG TPA: hypothetical protein EYH09_00720, partial [Candidatus Nanopusillus sp.]|nr:hypothetical protein [Candidatus Nanopusillus sp.]
MKRSISPVISVILLIIIAI